MSIFFRNGPALLLLTLFFTTSGCASSPQMFERDLAREAVQDADRAGAATMAVEEYREARSTLDKGETLLDKGDLEEARATLDTAIAQAHQAEVTAYIRSLNLAENQIHQLEIQKKALLKAWRAAIADQAAVIDFAKEEESQPETKPTSYTVTNGENLFVIASRKRVYGDPLLWPLIYKANRDQIKDPQQIYPGQRLSIPRDVSDLEMEQARNTARESTIFTPATPKTKTN